MADAEALAGDLEDLGPTFVKLGQLLSTRADLLPADLPGSPDPPPGRRRAVRLRRGRGGRRAGDRRPHLERIPVSRPPPAGVRLARAGAPRRAARRTSGGGEGAAPRHPGPDRARTWTRSTRSPSWPTATRRPVGAWASPTWSRSSGTSLMRELDYRQEAANLVALGSQLADHELIVVPQPIPDYSSELVLTMDHVSGHQHQRGRSAAPHGGGRAGAGPRPVPRLPGPDPRPRPRPRRPAPRQRAAHRRRPPRPASTSA